jgi:hypothetical protein
MSLEIIFFQNSKHTKDILKYLFNEHKIYIIDLVPETTEWDKVMIFPWLFSCVVITESNLTGNEKLLFRVDR